MLNTLDWENREESALPRLLGFVPEAKVHRGVAWLLTRHLPGYRGLPDFVEGKGFRPWHYELFKYCWGRHEVHEQQIAHGLLMEPDTLLARRLSPARR